MASERAKNERASRREDGIADLECLITLYSIANLNAGYQFRINGVLDLFPTNYRFHNLRTDKRGVYPSRPAAKLKAFIESQLAEAQTAPARQRPRIGVGGTCIFCGQPTNEPFSYICGECKGKSNTELLRVRRPRQETV